jgi:hypothetical protein
VPRADAGPPEGHRVSGPEGVAGEKQREADSRGCPLTCETASLTTHAREEVMRSDLLNALLHDVSQNLIADQVTVRVVDRFGAFPVLGARSAVIKGIRSRRRASTCAT